MQGVQEASFPKYADPSPLRISLITLFSSTLGGGGVRKRGKARDKPKITMGVRLTAVGGERPKHALRPPRNSENPLLPKKLTTKALSVKG